MLIDFSTQSILAKYRILSNTITPRPIAWVSTISENGIINLAPFSFFGVLSSNPPIFSLCIGVKSDGEMKDTMRNILSSRLASINLITLDFAPLLEKTSAELGRDSSEASAFNIPLSAVNSAYPPIVKGVLVAYFCELKDVLDFGGIEKTILLEAKSCYIDDEIYKDDLRFVPPHLGRVGKYYLQVNELIDPKLS